MSIFNKKFAEILSSQTIAMFGGLAAGILLAVYTEKILLVPGMLILLPGFLEMKGNIAGSVAARLSSGLYSKAINPKKLNNKIVKGNIVASFFLVILVSLFLGIMAFLLSYFVFNIFFPKIILIALIGGLIANLIEIPIAVFSTIFVFKKNHDPDDIIGPILTTVGDVASIFALLLAMIIV